MHTDSELLDDDPAYMEWSQTIEKQNQQAQDEEMKPQDQTTAEWLTDYENEEKRLMNINDVYESTSNFLKAADLKGNTIRLIITEVGQHTFDEGTPKAKTQIVLSFKDKEKKLGLNVTNARTIAEQLGDDTDNWTGKEIKIYPTKTDFGGEMVDCIRIIQETPPEAEFDEIPF